MFEPRLNACIAAALAGLIAAAPARAQKKPAEETPLSRCVADNRQAVADLGQDIEAARRKNVVNPMVITRLQALQAQVGRLRDGLPRAGRTLGDCEQLTTAIAAEKEKLQRIAGAEGDAASGDLPVAAVNAGAGRAATPAPAAASAAPPPPPPPPPVAAAPAAPAMSPDACRENQARSYNELAQGFAAIAQAGALPTDKLPVFQALSERLSRLRGLIVDRNAPGWDCQQVLNGLAQVKTELQPLMPARK